MKVYVVSHKPFEFPSDDAFLPIKVGTSKDDICENHVKDNMGENISNLNSSFCELTAAYWIWKNDKSDIVGLAHYRRYFSSANRNLTIHGKRIASSSELIELLSGHDILLAKPRNYYFFTIKSHYIHAHHESDYILLRNEVALQYPDYLADFDYVMNGKKLSLYNMFVCKKAIINEYYQWLFPILFALEKKIDYKSYDAYQKRVFGFMAERLFNIWIYHQRNEIKVKYIPVVNIDGENILLKGIGLLKRHFWSKK